MTLDLPREIALDIRRRLRIGFVEAAGEFAQIIHDKKCKGDKGFGQDELASVL